MFREVSVIEGSISIDMKRSDPAIKQPPSTTRRVVPLLANEWSHDRG